MFSFMTDPRVPRVTTRLNNTTSIKSQLPQEYAHEDRQHLTGAVVAFLLGSLLALSTNDDDNSIHPIYLTDADLPEIKLVSSGADVNAKIEVAARRYTIS